MMTVSLKGNPSPRESRELEAFDKDISLALSSDETLPEMLRLCCVAVTQHLDADLARIWLLNEHEQMLELRAGAGLDTNLDGPESRIPVGKLQIGTIAKKRKPLLTTKIADAQDGANHADTGAFAGYPLLLGERLVGVMAMSSRHPFQTTKQANLPILANYIALGIERKRIEEEMERQKNELRVLFDYLPAMICFKDTNNRILRVNKRLAEAVGKPVEEIEGSTIPEIFPQEAAMYYADDLEVIASGQPKLGIRESFRDAEGREFCIQTDKVPVYDADGKVTGFIVMGQDIAERVKREAALQEAQRFLQSTLDALSSHIAILDEHGTIIEVNAAWHRFAADNHFLGNLHGVGENYLEICAAAFGEDREEAPAVAAGIRDVMDGKRDEFHMEYPCHSPSEQRWFIVRATRFGGDGPVRIVVAHENITERKKVEAELRWQTALFEAQVNSSIYGVLVVDQQGKKILQNQKLADLLGIPQHIAESDEEVMLPWVTDQTKYPEQFLERVTYLYSHQNEISRDEIEMKNGKIMDLYSSPVVGRDGRLFGRIWKFRDITDRKRRELQLIQSQKLETVGKLAGGIAHEFNSILTAIIGQSELLLGGLPADSAQARSAIAITQSANRAATLTRQLLAYGRKQFLQPETLDLNRVIAGMTTVFQHLMDGEVESQIISAPALHPVFVDASQIEHVIVNLLINAREAMPKGGKLIVETANVTLDEYTIGHFSEPEMHAGEYVMLSITDTGIGMSAEVKRRAFEPFFSTKGVGEGTGLSLATCYGIVKQSGGHIRVTSEPGKGTTFKIYLPQADPKPMAPPKRLAAPSLPPGTETILLVEDDPALREIAANLLRRLGYTILVAASGMEALSLSQQPGGEQVDLLFTDLNMPQMGGKEVAERMQAIDPHIRILFTTAYPESAFVHQEASDQGVSLLQKPFTPSALAKKLREVLDQPAPPHAADSPNS